MVMVYNQVFALLVVVDVFSLERMEASGLLEIIMEIGGMCQGEISINFGGDSML